jgi:hypothetical protein
LQADLHLQATQEFRLILESFLGAGVTVLALTGSLVYFWFGFASPVNGSLAKWNFKEQKGFSLL